MALIFPGYGEPSTLAAIILPLVLVLFLSLEIMALVMNKVSFLRMMLQIQFGPAAQVGGIKVIGMYFYQYFLYLALGWWISFEVAPFFEGHLGSTAAFPEFLVRHVIEPMAASKPGLSLLRDSLFNPLSIFLICLLLFLYLIVKPAIAARMRQYDDPYTKAKSDLNRRVQEINATEDPPLTQDEVDTRKEKIKQIYLARINAHKNDPEQDSFFDHFKNHFPSETKIWTTTVLIVLFVLMVVNLGTIIDVHQMFQPGFWTEAVDPKFQIMRHLYAWIAIAAFLSWFLTQILRYIPD
ncbi:hypothetical protein BVX98_03565, partial [bacterium F11]